MAFSRTGAACLLLLTGAGAASAGNWPSTRLDYKGPIRLIVTTGDAGAFVLAQNLSAKTRLVHIEVSHYRDARTGGLESAWKAVSVGPYEASGPIDLSAVEPAPSWLADWTVDPADGVAEWAGAAGPDAPAPDRDAAPVYRDPPVYPQWCMSNAREEETVVLRFIVGVDGTTRAIRPIDSTDRCLDAPAVSAASKWIYAPKIENGAPVIRPYVETSIVFRLTDEP